MIRRLEIATSSRAQMVDVTGEVQRAISESGAQEGFCHIYVPHTTAGIAINENADPSVAQDILAVLEKIAPRGGSYRHLEGNADSHVKASIVGSSETVLIEGGRLVLGTWQGLFLCEFDGPRRRRLLVKVVEAAFP
ncbi:MAG: secondary thiamine-phosphate synthase enzyme YjbQ [Anaerolineae bacterium]